MGPPRTRATGKKSRNGCKTCKVRRVKCDEAKPFCLRCKEMHIACDGYEMKAPKTREHLGHFFPILPKGQVAVLAPAPPKTFTIILEPQPRSHLGEQETQYFNYFHHNTCSTLAEYLDDIFWNRIVLQATEQTLPIKHSVIALGALHKMLDGDPCPHGNASIEQNEHYRFALQQYGKSLKLTRAACSANNIDIRTLLISCFLSVCFEGIHGSTAAAVAHIHSGLGILNDFCSKNSRRISTAESQLLPGILEDEVVSVFARMENDVTDQYERVIPMHANVQEAVKDVFLYMPTETFESLTSARKYLDLMLREVSIFVTSISEERWKFLSQQDFSPDSESDAPQRDSFEASFVPTQQAHVAVIQECLNDWQHTFSNFQKRIYGQHHDTDLATTALSLRVKCAVISLSCCFETETSFDAFIPEFEIALQLAQTLHTSGPTSKTTRPTYITSSILIRSLYFIGVKCRSLHVRIGVLRILQGMRRREGIWDAGFVSGVVKCVTAIEEGWEGNAQDELAEKGAWYGEYIAEEHRDPPPESMRVTCLKTSFNIYKQEGSIQFLQTAKGSVGARFVVGERDIAWGPIKSSPSSPQTQAEAFIPSADSPLTKLADQYSNGKRLARDCGLTEFD